MNYEVRKIADAETGIVSIKLLSIEKSLLLALDQEGRVILINYATGKKLLIAVVEKYSLAVHHNSLLQVLRKREDS